MSASARGPPGDIPVRSGCEESKAVVSLACVLVEVLRDFQSRINLMIALRMKLKIMSMDAYKAMIPLTW